MNTEVKESQPETNGHVATAVAAETLTGQAQTAPSVKPRLRRRSVIAAITVVIALVIAGAIGTNLIARQYTPDGAVRQYLAALESGDASAAWNELQVTASQTANASLLDEQSLRAALAAAKPDITSFDITGTQNIDSSTTAVSFTYATAAGSKQAKLVVQRSGETRFAVFPVWLVSLQPTILQFVLPAGSGGVDIDGKTLALPAGTSTVAVLPTAHKITFEGSNLLTTATVNVDAFASLGQAVPYAPEFTSDGLAKVKAAVKARFDVCAQQISANPADLTSCPQTLSYSLTYTGLWSMVGDPTSDIIVTFDKDMHAVAQGHFQMVFAYQEDGFAAARHEPAGGGYAADLALTATDVSVSGLRPATGLSQLSRPAPATDQAVDSMVSAAFAKCAAARVQWVADCPQQIGAADATNVRWKLAGDPLSGALVTFDPTTGLITVHGNFQMSASYLSFGNSDTASSWVTAYNAYLLWDGQALQLVTIDGSTA